MHDGEYRSRPEALHAAPGELTLPEVRCQVRRLKIAKGFDAALEQRLAYLSEMDALDRETVVEALGM